MTVTVELLLLLENFPIRLLSFVRKRIVVASFILILK